MAMDAGNFRRIESSKPERAWKKIEFGFWGKIWKLSMGVEIGELRDGIFVLFGGSGEMEIHLLLSGLCVGIIGDVRSHFTP